jgi:hypothetical protein
MTPTNSGTTKRNPAITLTWVGANGWAVIMVNNAVFT